MLNDINGYTRTCGLIGNPVEHTLSPVIHNTLSMVLGENLAYVPFRVENGRLEDAVKGFELSIPVGLSYEISDFVIDARYNFGVTKVLDGDDCKNSVFQFTVGYKFAL